MGENQVPFVGRSAELAVLRDAWEAARTGTPRLVLVGGQAGIGKSALVDAFLRGLDGRVLRAGASEIETGLAFAVAGQLLGATVDGDPVVVGTRILQELSREGAVAVVVEDVHWADQSSLAALFFAVRRLRADPVLVVLTCRHGEGGVTGALRDTLDRLVAAVDGVVVTLPAFDDEAVAALVRARGGPDPGRSAARRLRTHTGGNPLHLRVLLDEFPALPDDGRDGVPLPAPGTFRELVGSRLRGCSAATRTVLHAAAVLGPSVPVEQVAALAGVPLAAVVAAVEDGVAASVLLRPTGRLRLVAFAHPLLRAALYHDLSVDERLVLHRTAAPVVAAAGGAELEVLRHEVAACVGTDADLADRVEAAADRTAATGAWAESAAAMVTARDITSDRATADRRLVAAVERLLRGGDVPEALALAPAVHALPDGPQRDYAVGVVDLFAGVRAQAEARLVRAWERSGGQGPLAGAAAAQVATLVINDGRGVEAERWARRAQALGVDGLLNARVMLLLALGCLGRAAEGLAEVAHLPEVPALVAPGEADGLLGRGVLRLWSDDLVRARVDLATVADVFSGTGPLHMRLIALYYLVDAEYRAGRWDDATHHGAFVAALADDAEQAWTAPLVHGMAALPFASRGDRTVATHHARLASAAAEAQDNPAGRLWAAMAAARLAQADADPAALVVATDGVAAMVDADGWHDPGIQPWQHLRVEGLAGVGRLEEARAAATMLQERTDDGRDSAVLQTTRVVAILQAAEGDPGAAERTCAAVADRAAVAARPFEASLLALTHGSLLRRAGRRRDAAARLETAHAGLVGLGAAPFVARCERELAACGRRVSAPATPVGLSPQERAVASLVARGASNREVAADLVVSVKTVEYHLGHVFTKLGVRSRTALAAALARSDDQH